MLSSFGPEPEVRIAGGRFEGRRGDGFAMSASEREKSCNRAEGAAVTAGLRQSLLMSYGVLLV